MLKFIGFLLISLLSLNFSNAQEAQLLNKTKIKFRENKQLNDGLELGLNKNIEITAVGSDDILIFHNLSLSNASFIEAELSFQFTVCGFTNEYFDIPGDYFITISFFDKDNNCLLSESFSTENGFTVFGIPKNEKSNEPLTREKMDDSCFEFTGKTLLPIHQAFLYDEDNPAGGVKPIISVKIAAFHLGAG